jgi:hypothetical protein
MINPKAELVMSLENREAIEFKGMSREGLRTSNADERSIEHRRRFASCRATSFRFGTRVTAISWCSMHRSGSHRIRCVSRPRRSAIGNVTAPLDFILYDGHIGPRVCLQGGEKCRAIRLVVGIMVGSQHETIKSYRNLPIAVRKSFSR